MKALVRYMDEINYRRSLFGKAPLDPYADYAEVRIEVEALGDPALLSGDGEYTRAETQRRTDEWLDAMQELNHIEAELTA